MKKSMRNLLLAFATTTAAMQATAQQNVGMGTLTPDVSARLDIVGTNRGLLIPRVALAGLNDKTTVPTPATGLLVFNTNAAVTGGRGFYYNAGTSLAVAWSKLQDGSGGGAGWSLAGNTDIDSITNFLGTTDKNPIVFRVNNKYAGQIGSNGGIALGRGANSSRITPPGVIAIGDSALFNNLDSSEIAIGNSALFSNDVGQSNTAVGNFSLFSNVSGAANVAVGDLSLASSDNILNTAVGYQALFFNQNDANTAVGGYALNVNTGGFLNVAVGEEALTSNDLGSFNTGIGTFSLYFNDGDRNTAIGYQALDTVEIGNSNTAVGADALGNVVTGSFNTAIGDSADVSPSGANFFNATAIGYRAIAPASNSVRIGNPSVTSITAAVNITTTSDGRYKKSVSEDVRGLDFIMKLRPVTYQYDFNKINADVYAVIGGGNNRMRPTSFSNPSRKINSKFAGIRNFSINPGRDQLLRNSTQKTNVVNPSLAKYYDEVNQNNQTRYTGFIAQEVEAAAKKIGFDFSGVDKPKNANDQYGLRYAEFVVPLVKAMQEQQAIIEAQNAKINQLIQRLEKLEGVTK
jgi:trimeric autotransporter adhesin